MIATVLPAIWISLQLVSAPLWAAETSPATPLAAPTLEVDSPLAREGYFVLSWQLSEGTSTDSVLQQSLAADFRDPVTIPVAGSGSLTLTGYADGLYHFRVGSSGQWSPVQEVQVMHHSLSGAMTWFSIGAVLFAVLAAVILTGAVRIGREERGAS